MKVKVERIVVCGYGDITPTSIIEEWINTVGYENILDIIHTSHNSMNYLLVIYKEKDNADM